MTKTYGATVRDLAREFRAQEHEIWAFADALFDGLGNIDDVTPIPADVEKTLREAWANSPDN